MQKLHLTGKELTFSPDEVIVTKTDLSGKITYANRTFYKLAGYTPGECIGKQHNIIRHPEMPRAAFKLVWDTIASGNEIFAYVNNRAKSGDHYWVLAHITPSFDKHGKIVGYHSNRRVPNKQVIKNHIIPLYDQLLKTEAANPSKKQGMQDAVDMVTGLLADKGMRYDEFIFSLGV